MSELIVASSPEALAGLAAEWLHREVTRAIEAPGRCSLCLAGGRTPAAAYRKLAALPLEWEKVEVFFGDERAVPSDDPESNYRMVRETLLDRVPIPPAQVPAAARARPVAARPSARKPVTFGCPRPSFTIDGMLVVESTISAHRIRTMIGVPFSAYSGPIQ